MLRQLSGCGRPHFSGAQPRQQVLEGDQTQPGSRRCSGGKSTALRLVPKSSGTAEERSVFETHSWQWWSLSHHAGCVRPRGGHHALCAALSPRSNTPEPSLLVGVDGQGGRAHTEKAIPSGLPWASPSCWALSWVTARSLVPGAVNARAPGLPAQMLPACSDKRDRCHQSATGEREQGGADGTCRTAP